MTFLIVTGMSGAGKSTALGCLEDAGFFCVDNMPPELIPKFAELCTSQNNEVGKVAFGIDIRGRGFFSRLQQVLNEIRDAGHDIKILFMETEDPVLVKRYKETRRRHPLLEDKGGRITRVEQAILEERRALALLKRQATFVLDTTGINIWQLKEQLRSIFVEGKEFKGLMVHIMSFGFKYGIPTDCDLVFDVRFIPNPYYIAELREKTGNELPVQEYVMKWDVAQEFLDQLIHMVEFLLPNYLKEGKNQLVIGIGCTGGKHRSVTIANKLCQELQQNGHSVYLHHREIDGRSVK